MSDWKRTARPDRDVARLRASIGRRPVPIYYVLAFAISWGSFLLVVGPGAFVGAAEPPESLLPLIFLAMYTGPSLAGVLMTGIVGGKAGFRELGSRLLQWRVGARWYAVALFTAPALILAVLLPLSLAAPGFLPGVFASGDRASLLLIGAVAGLATGFFEEIGWTGFAVPRLRLRHGVLGTGVVVGLLWGAWHFPLFAGGDPSGEIPRVLAVAGLLFTVLPPFRVLMVHVYDRTGSLPVTMLMHASLTASTWILQPLQVAGARALTYNLVLATVLWALVAALPTSPPTDSACAPPGDPAAASPSTRARFPR